MLNFNLTTKNPLVCVSASYSKNYIKNISYDLSSINDIIVGFSDPNYIDNYSYIIGQSFVDLKLFFSIYDYTQISFISKSTCEFFLRLWGIQNNQSHYVYNTTFIQEYLNLKFDNISSCLIYDNGKTYFNKYFTLTDYNTSYDSNNINKNNKTYDTKTNIPLVNTAPDLVNSFGNELNYKVMRYTLHSDIVKYFVQSYFDLSNPLFLFLIKDQRSLMIRKLRFYNLLRSGLFLSMFFVLLFWLFIIILIFIILSNITSSITEPINKLIQMVISMGQTNRSDEDLLSIDNIEFPEDHDIDDLFKLCKNLVKGGFNQENIKIHNLNLYSKVLNNISYIKTNNVIIDHDKIENSFKMSSFSVFNYTSKNIFLKENVLDDISQSPNRQIQFTETNSIISSPFKFRTNTEIGIDRENTVQNTAFSGILNFPLEKQIYDLTVDYTKKNLKKKNILYEYFENQICKDNLIF